MKPKRILRIEDLNFDKSAGLIPVIVQDQQSSRILTLAYANREAVEKTLETGYAHFYRRSFRKVMKKGETSGNFQKIQEILVDCDKDAIVYLVKSSGPACHLGENTCFHNKLGTF